MSKAHLIARIRVHDKEGLKLSSKCQRRLFLNMACVGSLVILKWKRSKAIKRAWLSCSNSTVWTRRSNFIF